MLKRFIKLDENNIVREVRQGKSIVEGEIQSDIGEIDQIMQEDGTFVDAPTESQPEVHEPTNTELAQMISDLQADLMIAGVI